MTELYGHLKIVDAELNVCVSFRLLGAGVLVDASSFEFYGCKPTHALTHKPR